MTLSILPYLTREQTEMVSNVFGVCMLLSLIGVVIWAILMVVGSKKLPRILSLCISLFFLCVGAYVGIWEAEIRRYFLQPFLEALFFGVVMGGVLCFKGRKSLHENHGETVFYIVMTVIVWVYILFLVGLYFYFRYAFSMLCLR